MVNAHNEYTMSDEVTFILDDTQETMQKGIGHLEAELTRIRAGKANPQMLEGISVDYYGASTLLSGQVANVIRDRCTDYRHPALGKEYATAD